MKLASITLPLEDPRQSGQFSPGRVKHAALKAGHGAIIDTLLSWCRGYTRVDVHGVWLDNSKVFAEPGYRYEFTSPNTKTARDELVALAYRIKTISDEEAIFIVHANGNAEIVR